MQVILCKTCIVYRTVFDTTNWFCGSLVFLLFSQWLFCWTSLPIPALFHSGDLITVIKQALLQQTIKPFFALQTKTQYKQGTLLYLLLKLSKTDSLHFLELTLILQAAAHAQKEKLSRRYFDFVEQVYINFWEKKLLWVADDFIGCCKHAALNHECKGLV